MVGHNGFVKQSEALRDLRALEEIERNPAVSQRELASKLGVAVGIANACVRTLARKGMVKIRGDNNRTITYHLTKKGILHKSRLAVEWTRNTIDFYREARQKVADRLVPVADSGAEHIALYGANELAEIAAIVAARAGLRVVAVIRAEGSADERQAAAPGVDELLGAPVGEADLLDGLSIDAVVVCVAPSEKDASILSALSERFPVFDLMGGEGR